MPKPSGGPSVGVEEEFFLADVRGRLVPCGRSAVDGAEGADGANDDGCLAAELKTTQIETNTAVCHGLDELEAQIRDARITASAAAARHGATLLAAGVPVAPDPLSPVTEDERYRAMAARYGALVAEHELSGCHVHVGIDDQETAVRVGNYLRLWLPTFLALTANSAVHRGRDTGFASWRTMIGSRWACSWAPPYFTSAAHYDSVVATMVESGAVLDEKMVYWDVRPSSHLSTVEIRVSDVPASVEETVLLASLIRGVVAAAERRVRVGLDAEPVPAEVLRAAYMLAARDGVGDRLLDPVTGHLVTAREQFRSLLGFVHAELHGWGELTRVEDLLDRTLARGNGAARQRAAYALRHDAGDVAAAVRWHARPVQVPGDPAAAARSGPHDRHRRTA